MVDEYGTDPRQSNLKLLKTFQLKYYFKSTRSSIVKKTNVFYSDFQFSAQSIRKYSAMPLPALVHRQPSFSFFTANDCTLTYDYQSLQFILAYIIMLHILQILTRIIIR